MNLRIILSLVFTGALLWSCEEELNYTLSEKQEVFFMTEYINYAWGYQHSGWIIDRYGQLHAFRNPSSWISFDSTGHISADIMDSLLISLDSTEMNINTDTLDKKINLIPYAVLGELSEPENQMADAGLTSYAVFLYDADKAIYQRVVLAESGDYSTESNSEEAKEITEWMKAINQEILTNQNK